MQVPFLDLKVQYQQIQSEIDAAIRSVIESSAFAGGHFVKRFETEFAAYNSSAHAIGVGSGTEALWLALLACGVGRGDEVITTPNTFIATVEAIMFAGAEPVFVDIDQKTYTMDPNLLEAAITYRTKAIIPVHMYGQPADMDPICEIARKHKLYLIEDACQAHGSLYKGKKSGTLGDAGCFSFYPGKNLGAYGEAGAVITGNEEIAEKIRMYRDHGQEEKYMHQVPGWNARMDGMQAAVLSVKLKHLNQWNNARRENAKRYQQLLKNIPGLVAPYEADYATHIYHIYAVRVKNRKRIMQALAQKDIHCGVHYPVPVHLQNAFKDLYYEEGSFPVTESTAQELLSLPMFAELSADQINYVARVLKDVMQKSTAVYS